MVMVVITVLLQLAVQIRALPWRLQVDTTRRGTITPPQRFSPEPLPPSARSAIALVLYHSIHIRGL